MGELNAKSEVFNAGEGKDFTNYRMWHEGRLFSALQKWCE